MKPVNFMLRVSLIICCTLLTSFSFVLRAQVIPANDNDIEKVIAKIPPIQRVSSACIARDCAPMDCRTVQEFHIRVRDARLYMRHLYYWLQQAGYAQMDNLKSVANETMMAADRAAKVQKILAWQQYVVSIAAGLLEIASAGSNFSEIVNDPKLLKEKSHKEMAELFDKFYEGSKDVESFIHRLMADRYDKDFPQPFADLTPGFAGITGDQMNELKSHLSDIKGLMQAGAEHGKDWRKILKEGKGLAAIGQIAGRFLKAYADAEIKEREQLVDDLLAGIIANDRVQSQSFKDLQRIQKRRNLAEDAYRALEKLVMVINNEGSLTRCLMRHASIHKTDCSSFDLSYTSKIVVPKDFETGLLDHPGAEGKAKNYGTPLLYFNARLPQVVALLSNVPALPPVIKNSLKTTKSVYKPGENMTVNFTASSCLSLDSWVAIFPASLPHGDDLASAGHLVSGRARMQGKQAGVLSFNAPDKAGAYQLRMFDAGSGKEIASSDFTAGSEALIQPDSGSCENLVVNGSFEHGLNPGSYLPLNPGSVAISGWKVIKGQVDYVGGIMKASHGGRSVDLDGSPGFGGVEQVVNTISGHRYKLTFDMAGNAFAGPTIKTLGVSVAGKKISYTHGSNLNWKKVVLDFTASQNKTILSFTSLNREGGYAGPVIDNVRVVDIDWGCEKRL